MDVVHVGIRCPAARFGVVPCCVGVGLLHDVSRCRAAPVHAIDALVGGLVVDIVYLIGEVTVEGKIFREVYLDIAVHLQLVVCSYSTVTLLLHGHDTVIVAFAVVGLDVARRNEERTPTPQILVDVGPGVGPAKPSAGEVEACANGQPVGKVKFDVGSQSVAVALAGIELLRVLLIVIVEGGVESSLA